ncbi:MAG: RluA family pseudouridine synthase [Hyphomicrobiaceae bacterium]
MSESEPQHRAITATDADDGGRLDRVLAAHSGTMSRSRIKALIKEGQVTQDGRAVLEPNRTVKSGETYEITIPAAAPAIPKGEDIPLDVVFEDDAVIVIDKPAGLVVHPAAGNWSGTLVNALIAHCGDSLSGIGGVRRPGIVHRLDKDTSGLMVIAKTDTAHKSLTEQFAAHGRDGRMQRAYDALIWGALDRPRGTVDAPLGRAPGNRTKMAVVRVDRDDAKTAVTHYEVQEVYAMGPRSNVASRVRCILETGRTHQIRVHMAHLGHPLLGDQTYGAGFAASANVLGDEAQKCLAGLGRQALHAAELGFVHPLTDEPLHFTSPLPTDISALAHALQSMS